MIVEDLIRLGKPLLKGSMNAREILRLVSDVNDTKVKNFYQHVIVVEIVDGHKPVAFHQVWGEFKEEKKKINFVPNTTRALGAPFILPQGGNPIHPQGVYGTAVYPCYERHIEGFRESSEKVSNFIKGRLVRTSAFEFDDTTVERLASAIHKVVIDDIHTKQKEKLLGVLILVDMCGQDGPYRYSKKRSESHIGRSHIFPDKFIEPNYDRVLELFWNAKLQEGEEKGKREGYCTICAQESNLITIYSKAWPWYLPTWTCPLPEGGKADLMIEGIGVCGDCYKALTYGACLFNAFTRPVQNLITREIFSPVADREGSRYTTRPPTISGSGLLLPLLDKNLEDEAMQEDFAENIMVMLNEQVESKGLLQRYITAVTGFELILPESSVKEDYRLSLIYYSGNPGRGDIHLRAYIEDVLPSTMRQLRDIIHEVSKTAIQLLIALYPKASKKQQTYYNLLYRSVPFVLTKSYGGAYVWDQLQSVLHRQPLSLSRPIRNIVERFRSVARKYPKTFNEICEEVIFFLTFLEFIKRYRCDLLKEEGGEIMRHWKELLQLVKEPSVENLQLNSPAELGFISGALIRQFGRQYRAVVRKDYMERILTFGSDLTPEVVWQKGLRQIFEIAPRYKNIKLSNNFLSRIGVILTEYDRLKPEIAKHKDEFMASFWAGYSLQGYDRLKTQK